MKIFKLLIILFFLLASPCSAGTQILYGAIGTDVDTGYSVRINGVGYWTADGEDSAESVAPCSFTITGFKMNVATAPGAGQTYTFTIEVAGSPSAASIVISNAETSGSWAGSVAVTAGQTLSLGLVATATPASSNTWWSIETSLAATTTALLASFDDNPSVSVAEYSQVQNGMNFSSVTAVARFSQVMPCAGTLKNFYVSLDVAAGDAEADSYTFTVVKNGIEQSLSTTIAYTATTGNDITHTVDVVAGDIIYVKVLEANSGALVYPGWGVEFDPTVDGNFVVLGSTSDNFSNSNTEYAYPGDSGGFGWTTGEQYFITGWDVTAKALFLDLEIDVGLAPNSETFTLQKNNIDSEISFAITTGSTAGNDTGTSSLSAGDDFEIEGVPNDLPTGGDSGWGVLLYIAPTSTQRRIITL